MSGRTRLGPGWGVAALGLACLAGCAGYRYPERTTVEAAVRTFHEAWRQGDVAVLDRLYTGRLQAELQAQRDAQGDPAVAAHYRAGAEDADLAVDRVDARDDLAVAVCNLIVRGTFVRQIQLSLLRKEDGWTIWGIRPLPVGGEVEPPGAPEVSSGDLGSGGEGTP